MTLHDKIRATITEHSLISRGDKIVVGVSGGPDSLALIHLLRSLRDEWQIQLHVAHLNHELRGAESDADADFVARLAREWDLPLTVESRDVAAYARENKLSTEEAAREVRYAFLAGVAQSAGARTVAVAHNADDQAETVLMHLLRGSGLAGLRGMRYKSQIPRTKTQDQEIDATPEISGALPQIIRPLLDITRAELETYCAKNSLAPRSDRSNLDQTFFRNRLRHEALPYLESLNPNIHKVLLHTARSISDDYDYIERQAFAAFSKVAHPAHEEIVFDRDVWRELHPALQRLTLRVAIQQLRRDLRNIDWTHIEDARHVALEKGAGAVATLPHGLHLTVGYEQFIVGNKQHKLPLPDLPQLNVECLPLPKSGAVELPASSWIVETRLVDEKGQAAQPVSQWSARFDSRKIAGSIFLRRRRAGDRFQPAGLGGHTKALAEFMIDEKIPSGARERLPLLVDNEKILWVCGYRVDERSCVTRGARRIIQVNFRKTGS